MMSTIGSDATSSGGNAALEKVTHGVLTGRIVLEAEMIGRNAADHGKTIGITGRHQGIVAIRPPERDLL